MFSKSPKQGDQVAILAGDYPVSGKVLGIALVEYAGLALTRLVDGREFFTGDGESVDSKNHIKLATDRHRAAFIRNTKLA